MQDQNGTRPSRRAFTVLGRSEDKSRRMNARPAPKTRVIWEFLLLALLSVARFCASGFEYFPQLDDYIQYYKYTALCSPAEAVIKYGMLAARPLSNAADVFVWAKFWPCLFAAVVIIALLYAASAVIFKQVFAALFPSVFEGRGLAFALLYLLLPLNIEGTYWLSASTRVVCGLFWTSLSALLFIRWLEGKSALYAPLALLSQLLAMASYEQALVLTVALTAVIAIAFYRRSSRRAFFARETFAFTSLSNGLIYWLFILQFRDTSPLYGSAYGAVLPYSARFWTDQLPHVLKQFAAAFGLGGALTLFKGALRGIALIISDGKLLFALLALVCAGLTALFMFKSDSYGSVDSDEAKAGSENAKAVKPALPILAGLLLAAAPLAPHVIKANPWFSLRGTVCSLPGIALCVQAIIAYALPKFGMTKFGKTKPGAGHALRRVTAAVSALFVVVCFSAAASELNDYRLTYEHDQAVMAAVANAVDLETVSGRIALVGVLPNYLDEQNFYYHEHIHGVTESDWALSGALYVYSGGKLDPSVRFVPLSGESAERVLGGETDGYDQIYIYADGLFVRADIN